MTVIGGISEFIVCFEWALRAAHLELSSDDCQIRWQLQLLQGPAKD